jgi:hypothetical protein
LEFAEEELELEGNAVFFVAVQVRDVAPHVDVAAELGSHEEGLEQTVHIAGSALVGQAHKLPFALHFFIFLLGTHGIRLYAYIDSRHLSLMVENSPAPLEPSKSGISRLKLPA